MKYTVAVETMQFIEVEAGSGDAAIEVVKGQMEPRAAAAAGFRIVHEAVFDEEAQAYRVTFEQT